MDLIDDVKRLLDRLSGGGWKELFAAHGLDIGATNLRAQLLKKLSGIDRSLSGFEDFAPDGERGIEPGNPSHSLLYHALASPNVQSRPDGTPLTKFPTLADLDLVENLVFGIRPKSLAQISAAFQSSKLVVAVFACDYRSGRESSHGRHADLAFSRCGVARIGTKPAKYTPALRGHIPFPDDGGGGIRVLPTRYVAYLAVERSGSANSAIPMRFRANGDNGSGDGGRKFLLPVHKLFDGSECLADIKGLIVKFSAEHVSEKLRHIHLELQRLGPPNLDTGADPADLAKPPYRITAGLGKLSNASSKFPAGVLSPVPHPDLIEPAIFKGKPAKFRVLPGGAFSSSLGLSPFRDRRGPEFVHARTKVEPNGSTENLNKLAAVANSVNAGNYFAQHYLDHTADGYVSVTCKALEGSAVTKFHSAFSLISAPDFFPLVGQRELTEWTEKLPSNLRNEIWDTVPSPLCDNRFRPNSTLPGNPFPTKDDTLTAVVGMGFRPSGPVAASPNPNPIRHSPLPDGAAGVFAPGWDTSIVNLNNELQLASFGLGSPFPEDGKLCAALSAFWPAVAPDISRSMEPLGSLRRTVAPLVDEEIGIGDNAVAWDGIPPLKDLGSKLEFQSMQHADYIRQSLEGELSLTLTGRVSLAEYTSRVFATAMLYRTLSAKLSPDHAPDRSLLYSFREVEPSNIELIDAQAGLGFLLPPIYQVKVSSLWNESFSMPKKGPSGTPEDRRVTIKKKRPATLFISTNLASQFVLFREDQASAKWDRHNPI